MEQQLLAASLKSRKSCELILSYINPQAYSRPFQIIVGSVKDYYARDQEALTVDKDLILEHLKSTTPNPKHFDEFATKIVAAYEIDVSEPNVRTCVLEAKKREMAEQLVTAIVNEKNHDDLLKDYQELTVLTSLDDLADGMGDDVKILENYDLDTLIETELDSTNSLQLFPKALGDKLESGLRGGDHILIFAPPEQGKTATCISASGGFCRQGARGIYFGNEDRVQRLLLRQISNLTGLSTSEIRANPHKAITLAKEVGLDNVTFIELSPGSPQQIEEYIKKYSPRWVIIDQILNLNMKAETRVNQLEAIASAIRNIGKRNDCIMISVTQAGDSAAGKEVLDMGDVYMSNTGIPAAVDVMIGIGMSPALEKQGLRMASFPKNKLGGDHSPVTVRINTMISRISSL